MADAQKITELAELAATPAATDILAIVDDPAGGSATKKITVANLQGSIGGIIATNLCDKSADEVITGEWAIPSAIHNFTASHTMVIGDAEQTVRYRGSTASQVFTIPANASVAFPLGTMIGIENDGTESITVAITTDLLTWSKDNTTGTRTLASGASAVIQKVYETSWKISGSALVT
ncbi:MAG: hypothetical protein ACKVKT_03250 [Rhodospirillales bacterium]